MNEHQQRRRDYWIAVLEAQMDEIRRKRGPEESLAWERKHRVLWLLLTTLDFPPVDSDTLEVTLHSIEKDIFTLAVQGGFREVRHYKRGPKVAADGRTARAKEFWSEWEPEWNRLIKEGRSMKNAAEIIGKKIAEHDTELVKQDLPRKWYGDKDRPSLTAFKENLT